MNYYEHHIGDYDKATSHLSACEDGIYCRLIRRYYDTESPIQNDIKAVQRLVRARTREEKEAVETVLSEFFTIGNDGFWHHKRCDMEVSKYQDKQSKARASANARWSRTVTESHSEGNANASTDAMRTHSEGNAHQTPDTRHQTPDLKPEVAPKALAASSPGKPATATRGSRLPADWKLPKPWGDWALENRKAWTPDHVRHVADSFRDFWIAKAGADAVKLDWEATWRNWVRKEKDPDGTPSGPAPRSESHVCECCGREASKRIRQSWYCPEHDQFSERIAA